MKKVVTLFVVLLGCQLSFAQGIEFFQGTWEEALVQAKAEDKIIFVDAYTTWCGPCKMMSKTVFTDPAAGSFYNDNFLNVKLDMEKEESLGFRQKFAVTAFPTLFYIDYTEELVLKSVGAKKVEGFVKLGKTALNKIDRSALYAEAYDKGDRSPQLVYNYIKALNKAGKPTLKIANEYIRSQKDMTTPDNLKVLLEATTQADSRLFDLLIENKEGVIKATSKTAFQEKIYNACEKTVERAIEFEAPMLLDEAVAKMKEHHPEASKLFASQSKIQFTLAVRDKVGFLEACEYYTKKVVKNDAEELLAVIKMMTNSFSKEDDVMVEAEKVAKQAAKVGEESRHYLIYASLLDRNGKRSKAIKMANKAVVLAKFEDPSAVKMAERYLEKLKANS